MRNLLLAILLTSLLTAGCIASVVDTPIPPTTVIIPTFTSDSATVPPTAPPEVTATETPTATPEPSPTTGPTAAATPTIPPTPDPNQNVGDALFTDNFTGEIGWLWTFKDDVAEFGVKDGQLNIVTFKQGGGWRYSLYFDAVHGDQQLAVSAHTNRCADADEYGVAYRGLTEPADTYNMYIFSLNCAGQARVLKLSGSDLVSLKDWQEYPAINKGANADNAITIWMFKDEFNFYVNDQYLFTLNDSTFVEGYYGFFVDGGASGDASFTFTNLTVREVKTP